MMTMSVGDLLDDWFENDALKGAYASTGVVGVWAGPRTPGTAYNLLHHELGELDGVGGAWGHVQGRDGRDLRGDRGAAPAPFGATIRTGAAVTSIDVARRPRHRRHAGRRRDDHRADRALGRAPEDDRARPRRRRALPRRGRRRHAALPLPRRLREGQLDPVRAAALRASDDARCCTPASRSARRSTTSSAPGRTRRSASPPTAPYIEVEVPTAIDPSLTDDGTTVMTMFTQYGPHDEAGWPDGAREAYAQRCLDIVAQHAPNVARRGRPLRGARAAGPRAHLRPRRRLDLPGRAGPRPDGVHAPDAAARALRDAGRRPVPVRRRDASGRRRDRRRGPQRRAARAEGPHASAAS